MINVTIIGFGHVGSTLSLLLLNNAHAMRINILEPNPQKEGAFLDLAHGMTMYSNKELFINNTELFEDADFIFFTAGTPNVHGGSRLSTAKVNIDLTRELFEGKVFKKVPYIIVITNPVDIISYHLWQLSGLPANHVVGTGTCLDSVRLSYYLSTLSEYHPDDFNSWVLGEHGDSMVPIYSMTTIKGTPVFDSNQFSAEVLDQTTQLTKNAAFKIRETQKGTTYGVSKCAEMILNALLSDNEKQLPLSVLTDAFYNERLHLNESIFISVPVRVSTAGISIEQGINVSPEELEALRTSAGIVSEIIHS